MNVNKSSLFWGILLIGGGVLALAQQMGYVDQLSETLWMSIFALVSLLAFLIGESNQARTIKLADISSNLRFGRAKSN